MNNFHVYKVTNNVNKKIYVGFTTRTLQKRLKEHYRDALSGNKRYLRRYFYNAIRKYGVDAFSIELIESYNSFEEMLEGEARWVDKLNSMNHDIGYNSIEGGLAPRMTEEIKSKISRTMKAIKPFAGHHHTEENKQKARLRRLGQKHSEETKRKIAQAQTGEKHWCYGKSRSQQTIDKISIANTGHRHDPESRVKMSNSRRGKTRKNKYKKSRSNYFGVSYKANAKKPWIARVTLSNGKRKYLGVFSSDRLAAEAYDDFVIKNNIDAPVNFC